MYDIDWYYYFVSFLLQAPQFLTFKDGKIGVNFGGYHAGVGFGGLLGECCHFNYILLFNVSSTTQLQKKIVSSNQIKLVVSGLLNRNCIPTVCKVTVMTNEAAMLLSFICIHNHDLD